MSGRRPEVFVSATRSDLRTCRQLVKEALLTLGCVPVEQTNFPPDHRTVREMLRARIASSDAVIHLAGECYGAEPSSRPSSAPRRSYTQLEYDLARELRKPLYVFLCGEGFPYDPHAPEHDERRELQRAHRAALATSETLRTTVASRDDLAVRVRELQTNVDTLTRELQRARWWLGRGMAAGLVLLLALGGGLWWLQMRAARAEGRSAAMQSELSSVRQTGCARRGFDTGAAPAARGFVRGGRNAAKPGHPALAARCLSSAGAGRRACPSRGSGERDVCGAGFLRRRPRRAGGRRDVAAGG
jgi:hypothetical protein